MTQVYIIMKHYTNTDMVMGVYEQKDDAVAACNYLNNLPSTLTTDNDIYPLWYFLETHSIIE